MKNRIKELRKAKNMSQIYLSIELEVSQETVSAYENGKHYPSFQTLVKLSEIFNTSIDYIMGLPEKDNAVLSPKEIEFLNNYRKLSVLNQEKTAAYIQGLSDSEK